MATLAQAPGDLDALADEIESGRIVTEADRRFGGEFIRSRISDRTGQGVDVHGQQFAPYSAAYAKKKHKAGGRVDQVDLYGTAHHPHMMNALLSRVTPEGFSVGFWGEEAVRAQAINEGATLRTGHGSGKHQQHSGFQFDLFRASGTLPARRFLDVNEEDLADVHEAVGRRIEVRLQRSTSLSNLITAVEE